LDLDPSPDFFLPSAVSKGFYMKKMAEFSMTKTRSKIEKLKPIYAIFLPLWRFFLKPM
jgi:hypothetical protein